jgi:hypothetical protein
MTKPLVPVVRQPGKAFQRKTAGWRWRFLGGYQL